MKRIYLDHAATTPLLPEVINTMSTVMTDHYGNPSSIHHHGRSAKNLIEQARKAIALELSASVGEIFFCSSATEAHNMILHQAVAHLAVKNIITTPLEHHCILHTVQHLEKQHNINVHYVHVDQNGLIDYEHLQELISNNDHCLVSIMHVNNELGVINDIQRISEMCAATDSIFHCDTVQAIGKIKIDLEATPMAFMAGSAHKFNGPKGVGFFYMNSDFIIPPIFHGGAQERNMRAGTENVIGIAGMAKALELAEAHRDERAAHIQQLNEHLINSLSQELDDIKINGAQRIDNIISVSFPPSPKSDLLIFNLDISGISCSSGSACSSGIENDSHVMQAIQHPTERKAIRFSLSHLNTMDEIDYLIESLKKFTPVANSAHA